MALSMEKWIAQPHVTKFELCIGYCDDELPYVPNYTTTSNTSCFSLQYVPSGKGTLTANGKVYRGKTGDLLAVFPNENIIECADSKEPWHFVFFQFSGDSARNLLYNAGFNEANRVLSGCQNTRIPALMRGVVQAAHDINNPFRSSLMISKCIDVFHEITHINSSREVSYKPLNTRDNYVQRIAYYISSNYSNKNLSIETLSRIIGLNRSYLYKVFKESTGISPQTYMMQIRINKACELLRTSETDIASIAYAVGYDPNSFSRTFKAIKDMTPIEYRKKQKMQ